MKIPFDIKHRPQIESGEYKVVTREGRFATIGIWQMKAPKPLVGCYQYDDDGNEKSGCWYDNGSYSDVNEHPYDLFIITPEPELTEFEKLFSELIADVHGAIVPLNMDEVKESCQKLMELAKKELCNRCSKCLDEYWRGRKEMMDEAIKFYPYEGSTVLSFWPSCPHGGVCTNPFHDCINCRPTVDINTATGTSTSKVDG